MFKAKNLHTGDFYAIKKFKNVANQGLPTSAIREIHSLHAIESPYVLRPIDVYTLPGSVNLVMEWKDLTLTNVISSSSALDKKEVMRELTMAVKSVHEHGFLHRDLKPSNVVMASGSGDISLRLIDFGMSKQLKWNKEFLLTNEVGTIFFRAPELLLGAKKYDYAVDLWALGCIFFQIITK